MSNLITGFNPCKHLVLVFFYSPLVRAGRKGRKPTNLENTARCIIFLLLADSCFFLINCQSSALSVCFSHCTHQTQLSGEVNWLSGHHSWPEVVQRSSDSNVCSHATLRLLHSCISSGGSLGFILVPTWHISHELYLHSKKKEK